MQTWPGLELRHLVALVAVADAGTISRAAEELGYTQSAVSQQIAALEKAVGSPVFDRPGGPRPLVLTETGERFDVLATVAGGGVNGQAGAIRLGIARALCGYDVELRKALKKDGLLPSDSRVKERKKYGLAGARKRFQFSKR